MKSLDEKKSLKSVGFIAAVGLLSMLSLPGAVHAQVLGEPFQISAPTAEVEGLNMYLGTFSSDNTPDSKPVVVQEMDAVTFPEKLTIKRTSNIAGIEMEAEIELEDASMSDVLMESSGLTSGHGTMNDVNLGTAPDPKGMEGDAETATLHDLEADVYFLSMGDLDYQDAEITLS